MMEKPQLLEDGTHVIPIWRIRCMDCEVDTSATGAVSWHPEKGITYSITFPGRPPQMLRRYYRPPHFSGGAGSLVEKQTSPRWIGETADELPIQLFGLDEVVESHTSAAGFRTEIRGSAGSASAEFTRDCPLGFYDQTLPRPRSFFLGFKSFHWPCSEEISFPHGNGTMQTSRRSMSLSTSPDVKIYEASSLMKFPDGAWVTNNDAENDAALTSYPSRSTSGFVSFLVGRRANFFWRDSFLAGSILRRLYNGSERVMLRTLRDALPPLPLFYSSEPNLAQTVTEHLPSLFATYCGINEKIDLPFILGPLWSASDGLITDLLALACVSLERLAEEWTHYNQNPNGQAKGGFWSRTQSGKVRFALEKALDAVAADAELAPAQIDIIKKRINSQLGQPANADKLISVFTDRGMELTSFEMDCVKQRNVSLHGRQTMVDCGDVTQIDAEIKRYDTIRMMIIKALLSLLQYHGPYLNYAARLPQKDFPIQRLPSHAFENVKSA